MKSPFANLARLWQAREPREQVMLIATVVLLTAFVFETFAYQPLRANYDSSVTRHAAATDDYRWLQSKARTVKDLRANSSATVTMTAEQKRDAIEQSLLESGMEFDMEVFDEEEGKGILAVRIKIAAGRSLMRWVGKRIEDGYWLRELSLKANPRGDVSATVHFEL